MTSKFVGYFLEQVSDWQKKLATSDSVITIWFEVQRTWSHLESIFIGSEDIRFQLPEHSKQFDTIDSDFKVEFHVYLQCPSKVTMCDNAAPLVWYICMCIWRSLPYVYLPSIIRHTYVICIRCTLSVLKYAIIYLIFVQGLMKDAEKTPNVVKACNKPRLFDDLEDLQKRYVSYL